MGTTQQLRRLIEAPGILLEAAVYDAFSARIVERVGFPSVLLSGNAVSASLLGLPDLGFLGRAEMVQVARNVAAAVQIPVIVDADTGYGNALAVRRLVQELEQAGAAGMMIEDQVSPKRCFLLGGHPPVVPVAEFLGKVEAALAARQDPDFTLVARTCAEPAEGLDDAIRRARAFRAAGADVVLVSLTGGGTLPQLERIATEVGGPLAVNLEEAERNPGVSLDACKRLGYKLASFPGVARYAMGRALREALERLRAEGSARGLADRLMPLAEWNRLLDLERWAVQQPPSAPAP